MKNRMLFLAAAGALASGLPIGDMRTSPGQVVAPPSAKSALGGMLAPQGGIGSILQTLLDSGGGPGRPPRIKYRSGGYSVAQGKRMATRRRNVLRARGHHRQAVR